ncbi:MAG: hypothetical protein V1776_05645 [Candidatus Diapherotrites archaeon]
MRQIMLFRLGTRDVHLLKLFGAFIILGAGLMLVQSLAGMFDSWENVKAIHACIDAANTESVLIQECQTMADYAFGILLRANQYRLTDLQIITGLLPEIANVFFWVGGLIIGMILYRSWKIMFPIEENSMNRRMPKWKKKK